MWEVHWYGYFLSPMISIKMFLTVRKEKRGLGAKSPENSWDYVFSVQGRCPIYIHWVLQKGHCRSFAENGRGLDPRIPKLCACL